MRFPHLPDWTIYAAVIGVILIASLNRGERADAPHDFHAEEPTGPLLGPITPFDPSVTVDTSDEHEPVSGTAFSIAGDGRWITARHVVEGCRKPALVIDKTRALAADVRLAARADVALLLTDGSADHIVGFPCVLVRCHPGQTPGALVCLTVIKVEGLRQRALLLLPLAVQLNTKTPGHFLVVVLHHAPGYRRTVKISGQVKPRFSPAVLRNGRTAAAQHQASSAHRSQQHPVN